MYIENLTWLSHIFHLDGLTFLSQGCVVGQLLGWEGQQNTHSKDRRESEVPPIARVQLTASGCPLPTLHTSWLDPTISEATPFCNVPWAVSNGFYYQGGGFLFLGGWLPSCFGGRYHSNSIGTCKQKHMSEEALQIAVKRREVKGKGEKERYTHLNAEFQTTVKKDKKAFLSDQCKKIQEKNRMGKTRDLVQKIRDTKGTFHANMGTTKDRKMVGT